MKKILIIDDVKSLRESVSRFLEQNQFRVVAAANGSDGLLVAQEAAPDLVLTDADIPGIDGHSLCRVLRRSPATAHIPTVIMSGEMIEEADIVKGLEGGADDYLIKPFPMKVMLARINAVLRRYAKTPDQSEVLRRAGIELDAGTREVKADGRPVTLARKEFDLLALFLSRPNRVLTASYLLETIWGYDLADYNDPHTVESHISRLRKKLGKNAGKRIVNSRGQGYKLVLEA